MGTDMLRVVGNDHKDRTFIHIMARPGVGGKNSGMVIEIVIMLQGLLQAKGNCGRNVLILACGGTWSTKVIILRFAGNKINIT